MVPKKVSKRRKVYYKEAVRIHCWECYGFKRKKGERCHSVSCPLFSVSPIKEPSLEAEPYWDRIKGKKTGRALFFARGDAVERNIRKSRGEEVESWEEFLKTPIEMKYKHELEE